MYFFSEATGRMEEHGSVAKGAAILIAANFVVKIIGVVYKIPLANILGSDGMGYLSSAYEIYQLLLTIFASGGALAVSKIIAESSALGRKAEVAKIMRLMFAVFTVVGAAGAALMYFGSGIFAGAIENPPAKYCIMVLSPAILFLSISCVVKGYYQGLGNMKPTAASQMLEAIFKLGIGVGFAILLTSMAYEPEYVAAGAISGTSISSAIGTVILLTIFLLPKNRRRIKELAAGGGDVRPTKKLLKVFWKLAIPLTFSAMVVNLTGVLDLFLIYNRLQAAGLDSKAANAAYGGYKGYAQTLFNLPPSIISSLNTSIIPSLSAAFVRKDTRRIKYVVRRSIKLVVSLALPCAVGLLVLAGPIQRMLYPKRLDEIAAVTPLLQILGVASFMTCAASLMTGLLQSSGHMRLPVVALTIGGAVKLAVNYVLVGIPSIGMIGAPIGTLLCYTTMFAINYHFFKKHAGYKVRFWPRVIKPGIASAIMGAASWGAQKLLAKVIPDSAATLIALILAVVIYGVVLLLIGGINEDDVKLLPKGRAIARALIKCRLLRPSEAAQRR